METTPEVIAAVEKMRKAFAADAVRTLMLAGRSCGYDWAIETLSALRDSEKTGKLDDTVISGLVESFPGMPDVFEDAKIHPLVFSVLQGTLNVIEGKISRAMEASHRRISKASADRDGLDDICRIVGEDIEAAKQRRHQNGKTETAK